MNRSLKAELLEMKEVDQAARLRVLKFGGGIKSPVPQEMVDAISKIDRENNPVLKNLIANYGWPGIELVGEEGAAAMWLLVQHQDGDVDFQKQCLSLLKEAVDRGSASYQNYAYLVDRVRKNEGLPQVYGTQWEKKGSKMALYAVEDFENLNQRRSEAGLGSLEEYKEMMKESCGFSEEDFEARI